ncbi:MAG: hypothetical protein OXE75_13935 [bacterium]|nr:hypothetical protein [bacterium]
MARVCCDPLIDARSGSVAVASAWKVMFDVPEMRIAAAGERVGSAGSFLLR